MTGKADFVMKILIVGAGGIGGFFGAKLHQAGADITYLLRERRYQHIQKQGLMVEEVLPSGQKWFWPIN